MIDRKTYLEMCQRYAVLPNSVLGIKDNVPDELKVTHKGHQYYPKSYTIEFAVEFTVDVVNDGSIDAMIESIEKTPELTSDQAKYLKYEVSYANGENINTKQLVKAGEFVRVKVSLEYRSDINPEDIPTSQQVLNLSIKLNIY